MSELARARALLPALLICLTIALSLLLSVRIGALTLSVGLVALALQAHLERGSRRPWRSHRSDLLALLALATATALLALLLP